MATKSNQPLAVITMAQERSTPGTHVYTAPVGSVIKGVYLQKNMLPEYPNAIRITVEAVEEE